MAGVSAPASFRQQIARKRKRRKKRARKKSKRRL